MFSTGDTWPCIGSDVTGPDRTRLLRAHLGRAMDQSLRPHSGHDITMGVETMREIGCNTWCISDYE